MFLKYWKVLLLGMFFSRFEGEEDGGQLETDPANDGTVSERSEPIELSEGARVRLGERELDYETLNKALESHDNMSKWQKSYTQRDMELAEQRKSVEKAAQLEEFLTEHPELYGEVEGMFKKYNQPNSQGNALPPEYSRIEREVMEMKSQLAVKEEMGKIQSEMAALESGEYKEYFQGNPKLKGEIAQFALENDIRKMDLAFQAYMFNNVRAKTKEEGMREGLKAGQRGRNLSQPSGAKAPSPKPNLKGSWDDVGRSIMNDPRYNLGEGD